jgi:SAM-dependent methyltransferase
MTMADDQGAIFFEGEGDRWFMRNAEALARAERVAEDVPLRMLAALPQFAPRRVLEVGCSNGWRLAALRERYGCAVVGVEPSALAIESGRRMYGDGLDLRRGLARALPVASDETFDVVIVSFVFHWISRDALDASIAEIDRVLAPGGYLVLHDFLPDAPVRRPYHHLEEGRVFTFKEDVAAPFLGTGRYRLVSRELGEHGAAGGGSGASVSSENRTSCDVLVKS